VKRAAQQVAQSLARYIYMYIYPVHTQELAASSCGSGSTNMLQGLGGAIIDAQLRRSRWLMAPPQLTQSQPQLTQSQPQATLVLRRLYCMLSSRLGGAFENASTVLRPLYAAGSYARGDPRPCLMHREPRRRLLLVLLGTFVMATYDFMRTQPSSKPSAEPLNRTGIPCDISFSRSMKSLRKVVMAMSSC